MSEDIAGALATPLAGRGLVCVDATAGPAGPHRVLRVLVDRDVQALDPSDTTSRIAPLTLDEVAEATGIVGQALDDSGLMGERPYTLEVSSPGVGRPLTGYAAFRRNVGRLVTVTLTTGESATARVQAVTPDDLRVEVPAGRKTPAQQRTIPLQRVRSGAVQVEFSRADDPADADVQDSQDSQEEEEWSHSPSAPAAGEKD